MKPESESRHRNHLVHGCRDADASRHGLALGSAQAVVARFDGGPKEQGDDTGHRAVIGTEMLHRARLLYEAVSSFSNRLVFYLRDDGLLGLDALAQILRKVGQLRALARDHLLHFFVLNRPPDVRHNVRWSVGEPQGGGTEQQQKECDPEEQSAYLNHEDRRPEAVDANGEMDFTPLCRLARDNFTRQPLPSAWRFRFGPPQWNR